MTTRTYTPRQSEIDRRWFVVDASGQTLGRLATQVARLLSGKHKPSYATHIDTGDHVIVINASRITVNGDKLTTKFYARHSGYPGGFRQETLGDLLSRRPEEVIRRAVKGMLPRNRLGVQQLRKLKVYAGGEHPHEAQLPAAMAQDGTVTGSERDHGAAESRSPARIENLRPAVAVTSETAAVHTDRASAALEADDPKNEAGEHAAPVAADEALAGDARQ